MEVSKKSFSKRSVVTLILMLETSGIFLLEQENKMKQRVNAVIDNLIANNAFEALTLQS